LKENPEKLIGKPWLQQRSLPNRRLKDWACAY
jgi:hypothetical protein